MKESDSQDDKDIAIRRDLQITPSSSSRFSLLERFEIAKETAEAIGRTRMVMADFLIETGLMRRRLKK